MAKIVEFIETYENRGLGTEDSIYRKVYQLWTKDGELVFEEDPCPEEEEE
ncbi:MAG: carboxypeptidase [Elusimicrobiota bacterium]